MKKDGTRSTRYCLRSSSGLRPLAGWIKPARDSYCLQMIPNGPRASPIPPRIWIRLITSKSTRSRRRYCSRPGARDGKSRMAKCSKRSGSRYFAAARKIRWLEIILDEGKNRQIRRMLESFGIEVYDLIRVCDWPLQVRGIWQRATSRPQCGRGLADSAIPCWIKQF